MAAPFGDTNWRGMSQEKRDLGLNNGLAVPNGADLVAGWDKRSAELRTRHPDHLDLRYGPRERNRIDFLKAAEGGPTLLFIHGGYWQTRAKESFTIFAAGPMAHGINVALIGYTLAPEATLDQIVAEIHSGLDFLADRLPALGGDPRHIVVTGWSAGGHLTSMALSHPHVKAGVAIGVCQVRLAEEVDDLVRLFEDEFELPLPTWVVIHEDLRGSPRCRVTFDALVRGLTIYMNSGRAGLII